MLQEQLTRLRELRELVVRAARRLQNGEDLRRLPLLVAHRTFFSREVRRFQQANHALSEYNSRCRRSSSRAEVAVAALAQKWTVISPSELHGMAHHARGRHAVLAVQGGCGLYSSPEADTDADRYCDEGHLTFPEDVFGGHGYVV